MNGLSGIRDYVKANGHNKVRHYFDLYDSILCEFRYKDIRLLEIGVFKGQSLKMWKNYFPNAQIVGLDIDKDCKRYKEDRVEIVIGDQLDGSLLKSLGNFDVIIDDGGHEPAQVMGSLDIMYPFLNAGGWYIMEDIHHTQQHPDFFLKLLDCTIRPHMMGEYPISEMRVLNNIVAIKKRDMELSISEGS